MVISIIVFNILRKNGDDIEPEYIKFIPPRCCSYTFGPNVTEVTYAYINCKGTFKKLSLGPKETITICIRENALLTNGTYKKVGDCPLKNK